MSKIRLIITSIISIVLVSILLIGSTYSIFTTTEIDENSNVYKTGDLNINYSSNNVKITDTTPMTIEEADAVIPHRITVTNNGNVAYQFDVILTDTTSSGSITIDYQYIMTKVGYLEPKKLSDCTNNIIKEDVILLPGEVVDIDVRIWLSDNIQNSEMGKSFYAKLSIDGQAVYNDNEEIDNDILSLNYMEAMFANRDVNKYYRSDTYREYIKTASFVEYIDLSNTITNEANEKIFWDVSQEKNESVIAWLEDNGDLDDDGNKYYDLYIGAEEKIYGTGLNALFARMTTLENISFDNLDTTFSTTMQSTFENCNNLTELYLGEFDTSNIITMYRMFGNCSSLTELDLSGWDTSKVTNMRDMFHGCNSLSSLDVSSFDTSNVTVMNSMFVGCSSLTELDLSNFNTSSVTNMSSMFKSCSKLTILDVSNFNTSKVTNMSEMFYQCSNLTNLDVREWVTSNVTNFKNIFRNCSSLTELDVSNFDTSKVTNMNGMFMGILVTELDLSNFDTSNVTDMGYMFYEARNLKTALIIRNASTTYINMFQGAATAKDSEGNHIGKITINYIPDDPTTTDVNESTEAIVGAMIATGTGNIVKGCYGINCPVVT